MNRRRIASWIASLLASVAVAGAIVAQGVALSSGGPGGVTVGSGQIAARRPAQPTPSQPTQSNSPASPPAKQNNQ